MTDQPMPRAPKTWVVKTRSGDVDVTVATKPTVSAHGHLIFDNGICFNRSDWQCVIPKPTP